MVFSTAGLYCASLPRLSYIPGVGKWFFHVQGLYCRMHRLATNTHFAINISSKLVMPCWSLTCEQQRVVTRAKKRIHNRVMTCCGLTCGSRGRGGAAVLHGGGSRGTRGGPFWRGPCELCTAVAGAGGASGSAGGGRRRRPVLRGGPLVPTHLASVQLKEWRKGFRVS